MTAPQPSRDDAPEAVCQPFEAHPKLKAHVQRMAWTGAIGTMWEWNEFLLSLNEALSPPLVHAGEAVRRLSEAVAAEAGHWPIEDGRAGVTVRVQDLRDVLEHQDVEGLRGVGWGS